MKEVQPDKIRNIALISHQSAGKTTLCESLLLKMGAITRMGTIEEGNTVSDYKADEVSRQMSISTTLVVGEHKGHKLNILDTPGFTDFSGEVKSAIRVADSVGVLIHATAGVEVGTELVWGFAEERKLPRFFILNHLDRENVDFDNLLNALKERFTTIVPLHYPVNPGSDKFNQIIDLTTMKLVTYNADGGEKSRADIPADLKDKADEMRLELVEAVAESDDELMEKFFENDGLTQDEFMKGLKIGLRAGNVFPLLCTSVKRHVGTTLLLDFLLGVAPSPVRMPEVIATKEGLEEKVSLKNDPEGPFGAFVFKTVSDKHVGDLSFFRVYSGTMTAGTELRNTSLHQNEKVGQIFSVSGKTRTAVDNVIAGDMGALVKLKDTHTSNTLSMVKDGFTFDEIEFPDPVTRIAIVTKNKGDEEKISNAIHILSEEDPSFQFNYDAEMGQLLLSGQGELHLDIIIAALKDRFGVEVDKERPKIAYREAIRTAAEGQGKYKKQSGGRGQYGDCWLKLEPQPRGAGYEFVDAIVGGVIPGKFIPAVEKGVSIAMTEGVIAGFPVIDVKSTCYDGSFHTVDSSENAFKMAGSMAFRKVFAKCKPVILEPVDDLEVRVPEEFMGDVMGDISSKRGKIMGMDAAGGFQIIRAKIPLAELHLYSSMLRSITGGRGLHKSSFSHYEEVPMEIQQKLVEEYEAKKAEGNL